MAAAPRVVGDTPVHTVIVDWDGTAVPAQWPERPTEFMPGFVENMRRLHREGVKITINSARYNPYDPWTRQRREPAHVFDGPPSPRTRMAITAASRGASERRRHALCS